MGVMGDFNGVPPAVDPTEAFDSLFHEEPMMAPVPQAPLMTAEDLSMGLPGDFNGVPPAFDPTEAFDPLFDDEPMMDPAPQAQLPLDQMSPEDLDDMIRDFGPEFWDLVAEMPTDDAEPAPAEEEPAVEEAAPVAEPVVAVQDAETVVTVDDREFLRLLKLACDESENALKGPPPK